MMSPLQPMIWTLIIIGFVLLARWVVVRPPGGFLGTSHADRMTKAEVRMWRTGECDICDCRAFDHTDDCALHIWLGGDDWQDD